jgi:acetyl esterase/lipase
MWRFMSLRLSKLPLLASLLVAACTESASSESVGESQEQLGFALPPSQPATGPGGKQHAYSSIVETQVAFGAGTATVFEPGTPTPAKAPVIIFCGGWLMMQPLVYTDWVQHLVLRGNIVIYPQYQEWYTISPFYTPFAIQAVNAALAMLGTNGHVAPDLDRVAVVGHSAGGVVAANLAALAGPDTGLPQAKALMAVEPGLVNLTMPLVDLSRLPPTTLLLSLAGESDALTTPSARALYRSASGIPIDNKDYVVVPTDTHGLPLYVLWSYHGAPTSVPTDALDFYGYWKLFDGLTDAAFYGTNRQYALGNTPEQRFMGVWSDGVPVRALYVTDDVPGQD